MPWFATLAGTLTATGAAPGTLSRPAIYWTLSRILMRGLDSMMDPSSGLA